ncbi:MAG: type II toxin-antitoxin system PemK/MazF family toxin [Veillonellales bacterium]
MFRQSPEIGDIILLNFVPQSGNEIQKRRPALVISCTFFNETTGFSVVCPITSTQNSFPLHISLDSRTTTHGDILIEQLKSLDYNARSWSFLEKAPNDILDRAIDLAKNYIIGK